MRRLALLLTALLALPVLAGPAHAQDDDWEVKHDPFDKKVIGKYKAILAKHPHDSGALAKLLSMYRRYRTVDLLESEYKKVLDKKSDDYATLVVLGYLRKTQGDEAGALGFWEKAAATGKDDPALLVELGALYRNAGKNTEAKGVFDKALAATKDKDVKKKALRALADLSLGNNDIEQAKKYFDDYIALEPKNAQLRLELGDALLQANKHDEAIAAYRDAEKMMKGDASRRVEVVIRIGQALEGKGSDDDAVAEYRRALGMVPRGHFVEGEVTLRIIDIYRRKQELPTLLAYYEKEWPAKSRKHFEWSTLASLYEETGAGDKAIDAYKKAVKDSPWELETQRRLIQLLENVGREDEAIKQYEAVVKVAPSESHFQLELASRYWHRGDEKKALATLKKIAASFPSDPGVVAALADLYQQWGKEDLALAAYEKLAKLEPDDPAHLQLLGEQYWNKGDKANHDKAIAIWKRIAAPGTAESLAKLGDVLAEHGMQVDALANYAKAIKKEPKNFELYKGRAAIYESQKQWAEAMADWEAGMALLGTKPGDRVARREARRHIVTLLTRWGGKEADYRNKWVRDFKKSPPDLEAGYFLVEYYDRRPQAGEPKTTLEKLRTLVPEDQEVIGDLVEAYKKGDETQKAVDLLLELEKIAPNRKGEIYSKIADILTDAGGRDEEAIGWAKKAIEISNNKSASAWVNLAEQYHQMGRYADEVAAYEAALAIDRTDFKATSELAKRYQDLGEATRPKAAELYRRILKESSDDETLLKAGNDAISLEEAMGTLGDLEKTISPLAFQMSHKPVYRKILVNLYIRYVRFLSSRLRHGDAAARKQARTELDRLGQHGLKPLLEALNDDKDSNQQKDAIEVLGYLGNPGAAPPLVRIAITEPKSDDPARKIGTLQQSLEWQVRVDALVAAGRLGDKTVLDDVLKLVKHDEVAMREAAIFTIGRTRDKRSVTPLINALGDRRESVQALACLGLSAVEDAKGIAAMADVVADGKRHDNARAACAFGLGVRKAKSGIAALTVALGDNRGEAQRLAAWALAQIGDQKALPELIQAYFTRDDDARPVFAWAVAHLVGAVGDAPATADLTDYPVTGTGTFHTAIAIGHLPGDLPAVHDLSAVVPGNETAVAAGIRDVLGEHRDRVLGMLVDLDQRDSGLSLGTLLPTGTAIDKKLAASLDTIAASIAKDVMAHLDDQDSKVRAHALSVAAKIDATGLADAVAKAFTDTSPQVRRAAMQAVVTVAARHGEAPEAMRTALAKALDADEEMANRRAAVQAERALGAQADVQALIGALGDDQGFVRSDAADALGALKAKTAVDALLLAADDDTKEVRAAAAAALVAIGDPRAKAKLAELAADDPDEEVRRAAGGK